MSNATIELLMNGTLETIYMVGLSGLISTVFGLILGVILFITRPNGVLTNLFWHKGLGMLVNIVRAIPFIILLIALIPFTRLLIGTAIGINAAIVPLSIGAIPFVARIIENALLETSQGLVEAGLAMGASTSQLISKILLPEALPSIVNGITLLLISLVSYSAMAGTVGGGGLGSIAINYGYLRFDPVIMYATVFILILLVFFIQYVGEWIAKKLNHR